MRIAGIVVAIVLGGVNAASSQVAVADSIQPQPTVYSLCQQFQTLYVQIREQTITPDSARARFAGVMQGLRLRFSSSGDTLWRDSLHRSQIIAAGSPNRGPYFAFPLRTYNLHSIGGTHGEGYRDRGFDLFDFNVRGSHPAQDIFITDRNQDNLDDRTQTPVEVVAMSSGLVVGVETGWNPGQSYRGGNWIWVYDPLLHGLFYYAHNNVVAVTLGQWVQAGDRIGEVGRTGFNAYKVRSPTHLHLMYLQIQPTGLPLPQNPYAWLLAARPIP